MQKRELTLYLTDIEYEQPYFEILTFSQFKNLAYSAISVYFYSLQVVLPAKTLKGQLFRTSGHHKVNVAYVGSIILQSLTSFISRYLNSSIRLLTQLSYVTVHGVHVMLHCCNERQKAINSNKSQTTLTIPSSKQCSKSRCLGAWW